jgi:hypothetical protein
MPESLASTTDDWQRYRCPTILTLVDILRRGVSVIISLAPAHIKRAKLCRVPAYDCCDGEDAAN